jgi:adenosine deaminase
LKAAVDQGLNYYDLKTMARNSLTYSFISGGSLWSDGKKFVAVAHCRTDMVSMTLSPVCRSYVDSNPKAKLQWQLEEQFRLFERAW